MSEHSRRAFLEFMGRSGALAAVAPSMFVGCSSFSRPASRSSGSLPFEPISPNRADSLTLANGFEYRLLIEHGALLNQRGDRFGYNNDYLEWVQVPGSDDLLLWVNHEYVDPMLLHGKSWLQKKTKEEVDLERREVGGSIVRIRTRDNQWRVVQNDAFNRRIDGTTAIPLVGGAPIRGERTAIGTLANCAGGKTPWGSVLTCEENFDNYYPEQGTDGQRLVSSYPHWWHEYYDRPSEHYGWVVEVNLFTGAAKKLLPLGRFAHECATVRVTRDGRCVVYSGDDKNGGCLYKFVANRRGTLESGTLYVADIDRGRWVSLDRDSSALLSKDYPDQTSIWVDARGAAKRVGGTPLDRPEDIEIDPLSGAVLISLTNNKSRGNYHGSILRVLERGDDPSAVDFSASQFLAGGSATGLTCPDNLTFDSSGHLWITNDVAGNDMKSPQYRDFGNNGLFFVPMHGSDAGRVFQVAAAPNGAELTGPKFSPDGRTLFLSVQHPGEDTKAPNEWSSHWPHGGTSKPKPAVVAIRGSALDAIVGSRRKF